MLTPYLASVCVCVCAITSSLHNGLSHTVCCTLLCCTFQNETDDPISQHIQAQSWSKIQSYLALAIFILFFFAPLFRSCISESSSLWCYVLIWEAFHVSLHSSLWLSKTLKVPVCQVKSSEWESNGNFKASCWALPQLWLTSQWQRKLNWDRKISAVQ